MTATLFGIFCQKRSDSVYTERKVKWGLSCGSEGFQNKNKLFLLNPNSVQLQPSPDFLLDVVALLTNPLPLQVFAFRSSILGSSLFLILWPCLLAALKAFVSKAVDLHQCPSLTSPMSQSLTCTALLFLSIIYILQVSLTESSGIQGSQTIHLLFKKLSTLPSALPFELEVHSPSLPLTHSPAT